MSKASNTTSRLWISDRFIGLRLGRYYFKLRDTRRHPLLFSERNGYAHRRLAQFGSWHLSVRTDGKSY